VETMKWNMIKKMLISKLIVYLMM